MQIELEGVVLWVVLPIDPYIGAGQQIILKLEEVACKLKIISF